MSWALPKNNRRIQDWITQQWVILFGTKIDSTEHQWLLGPFGKLNGIGYKYINELALEENLVIDESTSNKGLIESIKHLITSEEDFQKLSPEVIDFYENTSNYQLHLKTVWNPCFRILGVLLKIVFSKRIQQLNLPLQKTENSTDLTNEVIKLIDSQTRELKRTIWLRAFRSTNQVVYSGIYETSILPNKQPCIKAIFPLPNGNATIVLTPKVEQNGELVLMSSGNKIGESGFYFLLHDSKGQLWTKFIKSFKDQLVVKSNGDNITAIQTLTFWKMKVLEFEYQITLISTPSH